MPIENDEISRSRLLNELRDKEEKIEVTLGYLGTGLLLHQNPVEIGAVSSALSPDTVLLEYLRYYPFEPTPGNNSRWRKPRYACYSLDRNGNIVSSDLGDASYIESVARQFLNALGHPDESDYKPFARELFRIVLGPFQLFLPSSRHLIISPDGILNVLPFAALITPDNRHLVEKITISYVSSGRDLSRQFPHSAPTNPPLILADPDYGPAGAEGNGVPYHRLEGSREEANFIRALLPRARVFFDAEASKATLFAHPGPVLLHLATHGEVLPDIPDRLPGTVTEGPRQEGPNPVSGDSPLLRSWLALAGANNNKESGILTALELTTLDLRGTHLVVASACKTGLGGVEDGEGVHGLRRAFLLAGSESLLISLWNVGDEGTLELMQRIYQRLHAEEPRAEALCEVQRDFLRIPDLRHPFFWASFILVGAFGPVRLNSVQANHS